MNEHWSSSRQIDKFNALILLLQDLNKTEAAYYADFLSRLQEIIYFDNADIMFYREQGRGYRLESFYPLHWKQEQIDLYTETFFPEDDGLPIFARKSFVTMRSDEIFANERENNLFSSVFLKNAGYAKSLECNIVLNSEENLYGICTLTRQEIISDFSDDEKRILELVQPHLSFWVDAYKKKEKQTLLTRCEKSGLSCRIFLDAAGKLLYGYDGLRDFLAAYKSKAGCEEILSAITEACVSSGRADRTEAVCAFGDLCLLIEFHQRDRAAGDPKTAGVYDCTIYNTSHIFHKLISIFIKRYNLTAAEETILKMRLFGYEREQIAQKLFVSVPSVKKHISSIYAKVGIENQYQLCARIGLLDRNGEDCPAAQE